MKKNVIRFVSLAIFAVALWMLHHELQTYHYHDILQQIRGIPVTQLIFALIATVFSYTALIGYDLLAVRYTGCSLHYSQIAPVSFISYSFSNNIANPLISGAIRYRLYSTLGLSAVEIGQIIAFCELTFWIGFLTLGGVIFLLEPLAIPDSLSLPFISLRVLGVIFLIAIGLYLMATFLHKQRMKIGKWEFTLPSIQIAISQILISCVDWALASTVIYLLLPATAHISYPEFLGMFLLAQILGIVSQVPAGIGVFETLMILFLKPAVSADIILGALVVYRVLYYLLPLIIATILLTVQEIRQRQAVVKQAAQAFEQWISPVIPHIFALTTFIGGIILLVSGVTPSVKSRLVWLKEVLPLPVIELSHFIGSLTGVGLILLARGLQRRLDGAYFLTIILLGTGIVVSLLKGGDYEEALILAIMLMALLPCRRQFYRKASLIEQRFTPGWLLAIGVVLTSSIWLGFFAYKHVEYSHELWWRFSIHGEASRFLRATVGTVSLAAFFALFTLIRSAKPKAISPTPIELERIRAIVHESPKTIAYLALLGDKQFLFSSTGKAFIMYGIEGKSWIAIGDPVGPQEEHEELVWRFRELCDRYGGWMVFHEAGVDNLPLYIDQGLTLLKIGEEARVPLTTFSLEGSHRKGFRHTLRKLEKEEVTFEILPSGAVSSILPELRAISDDWLSKKNTHEKQFSLGFFDPEYLVQTPVGVVRHQGRIVAFANLWLGGQKVELSIDLMRYSSNAPSSVMDYLFIQLMLWGKKEGYTWFNLGMAPLSGIEDHASAPLWNRISLLIYRHGEHFFNFQGLRQYKDKFDPVWKPMYLISPGGVAVPLILTDLAALNSGGLKGIISR